MSPSTRPLLAAATALATLVLCTDATAQAVPPATRPATVTANANANANVPSDDDDDVEVAPPAATVEPQLPWSVTLGFGPIWRVTPGYEVWTDRDATGFVEFSLAREVVRFAGTGSLQAEIGYRLEPMGRRLGNDITTSLTTHVPEAGLSVRWTPRPWFVPYVRAMFETAVQVATVTPAGESALRSTAVSFGGTVGAGVVFQTRALRARGSRSTAALFGGIEAGADLRSGTDVALDDTSSSANGTRTRAAIPVQSVTIGSVNPLSPYLRLLVGVRF